MLLDDEPVISRVLPRHRFHDINSGEYLLMTDLNQRTKKPHLAWIGTQAQAKAVLSKFPHTRAMTLEVIKHKNNKPRN